MHIAMKLISYVATYIAMHVASYSYIAIDRAGLSTFEALGKSDSSGPTPIIMHIRSIASQHAHTLLYSVFVKSMVS